MSSMKSSEDMEIDSSRQIHPLNQYPELLKVCTESGISDHIGLLNTQQCSCECCSSEGFLDHSTMSSQSDSVQLIPGSNGIHVYACPPNSHIASRWTTIRGESAQKCLSWTERYSNLDFFRTIPDGSILYSPYMAVSNTQYMFRDSTQQKPEDYLYPGGATVPEHCLKNINMKPAESDWIPNVDPMGCHLGSKKQCSQGFQFAVPTKSCSQVSSTAAVHSKYNSRSLCPELVPSDLAPGNKSYHMHSSRPYPRSRTSSKKYPKSDTKSVNGLHDPDIIIGIPDICASDTNPKSCVSSIRDPETDIVQVNGVHPSVTIARPEIMTSENHDPNVAEDASHGDICERPDSAISEVRPGSARSFYEDLIRPDSALGNYVDSSRPDSALSNCVDSIRADSALSNYDSSLCPDSMLSNYNTSNHDQSLRPGSAFSQFSEFDSGIDESRFHLITPPPGLLAPAPYTAIVDSSDDHHSQKPQSNLGNVMHSNRPVKFRIVENAECPDEHCVTSTSEDTEPVDETDVNNDHDDDDDDDLDKASITSGSSCSSGRLMINTDSDLDDELAVHDNSNPESDSETAPDDQGCSPRNDIQQESNGTMGQVLMAIKQTGNVNYGHRTPVRSTVAISHDTANLPCNRPAVNDSATLKHVSNTLSRENVLKPTHHEMPPRHINQACISGLTKPRHVAGNPGYLTNPRYVPNPAYTMNPAHLAMMHNTGYCTYPYPYPTMWNCYPGVQPCVPYPSQYMNYMPWYPTHPGYYPQMSYAAQSGGYMMAPLGTPALRPGGIQKKSEPIVKQGAPVSVPHHNQSCDEDFGSKSVSRQHTVKRKRDAEHDVVAKRNRLNSH